jgi:hypothetical protein
MKAFFWQLCDEIEELFFLKVGVEGLIKLFRAKLQPILRATKVEGKITWPSSFQISFLFGFEGSILVPFRGV